MAAAATRLTIKEKLLPQLAAAAAWFKSMLLLAAHLMGGYSFAPDPRNLSTGPAATPPRMGVAALDDDVVAAGHAATPPRMGVAALDDDVVAATPAPRKSQRAPPTPTSSGRFHWLEVIGAGTFGVVYRARDRRTGEIVAMKCLRASDDGDDGRYLSDFAAEVSALEACSGHPSIVQPRASGHLGSEAFLAMEFVGPTLRYVMKHVRFGRRHTELEVRLLMRQLCSGVRRMNRLGLMHRDLKPENVLVDSQGNLKICDLGLSCSMADEPPYYNPIGTQGYRAPELLLGCTDYDEHVDSWALGIMMAELLVGKHPFHGRSDTEHLSEILDLLGTADIKEWSGYDGRRLPSGSQPGSFLRNKFPCPAGARIKSPPTLSEAGFKVLSGLLRCNPEKRLTAEQALKHRWFKEANPRATRR